MSVFKSISNRNICKNKISLFICIVMDIDININNGWK